MTTFEIEQTRSRVFLDTHVITIFKFLDEPDSFIPEGVNEVAFNITLPVVRELERIKNEHFSKGQRTRARKCLELLELSEPNTGLKLTDRSFLRFRWQVSSEHALQHSGWSAPQTPDEFFLAAIHSTVQHNSNPSWDTYVMSDDFGVRTRVKHFFRKEQKVKAVTPPNLRYQTENFELPRTIQEIIRQLARELAQILRDDENK